VRLDKLEALLSQGRSDFGEALGSALALPIDVPQPYAG
jgi:hypothetical protein